MTKQKDIKGGMENIIRERQPSLAQSYGNAKDSNFFIGATVRMLIEYLHSQGVVIKVERELPKYWFDGNPDAPDPSLVSYKTIADEVRQGMARYVAEPLIEEEE